MRKILTTTVLAGAVLVGGASPALADSGSLASQHAHMCYTHRWDVCTPPPEEHPSYADVDPTVLNHPSGIEAALHYIGKFWHDLLYGPR